MLQGANILRFFKDYKNRRWDNCDVKDFIAIFDTNTLPGFAFALENSELPPAFDVITPNDLFGFLYKWSYTQAVDNNSITSSDDWDIPTKNQYAELSTYFGGDLVSGGIMKEPGTVHWIDPNLTSPPNTFNLLPSGMRAAAGNFIAKGYFSLLWTKDQYDSENAYFSKVVNSSEEHYLETYWAEKQDGAPIRLVNANTLLQDGETGVYTGNNGQKYPTKCYGGVEWLTCNLIETETRDHTSLHKITNFSDWQNRTDNAYCAYSDNDNNVGTITVVNITPNTGYVAIVDISNENSVDAHNLSIIDDSGYRVLYHAQINTIAEIPEGYYYLKIVLGQTIVAKSDVFAVNSDTSRFMKFDVNSSDITLNESITLPFSALNVKFYLTYNSISIQNEVKEEGVEKSFGDIPVCSTINIINKVDINGTAQIFRMLSFLRAISVNGDIYITVNGITNKVYGLLTEQKDELPEGDTTIITFTYREYNFISSKNAI